MGIAGWDNKSLKSRFGKLAEPGVLGFHTHFEVTEIFGFEKGKPPLNILTMMVAEEHLPGPCEAPKVLNPCRLQLKSLPGWTFGIKQFLKPHSEIEKAFEHYHATGEWLLSGLPLRVGERLSFLHQFVPADSTDSAPLNGVLKNNFWNGSHVIECFDETKISLQPFLDEPKRLQELSDVVQKFRPLKIASLSDKLGNVILQFPVTIISTQFSRDRVSGDCVIDLRWHPQATPRPLRGTCEVLHDNLLTGYSSAAIEAPQTKLQIGLGEGKRRELIWDDEHHIILAATGNTSFTKAISMRMGMVSPEPRTFVVTDRHGLRVPQRVGLTTSTKSSIENSSSSQGDEWTWRRIYRDEFSRLKANRYFVQYRPSPGHQEDEHEKALQDLRYLLNKYGEKGAWLWDPYLSASDILKTLFFCSHSNADLRALTAAMEIPAQKTRSLNEPSFFDGIFKRFLRMLGMQPEKQAKPEFSESQRRALEDAESNLLGLRLEYRVRTGQAGWGFHDRFLIFPKRDGGAEAWSLGTSVNSLGKQHHILQKVDDGQLVMEAFQDLWDALNGPEYLIWKAP